MTTVTILGAGLSGLSTSYHLGHDTCRIFEAEHHYGGHIYSEVRDGVTWDDGPHVSYTKDEYVRALFAAGVAQDFQEVEARPANYYRGHWVDHPAQVNLYQVPEPLRTACRQSFLETRSRDGHGTPPADYREWLHRAFGPVFAETFPAAYTRKYWTTEPSNLGVDWIGTRVFYPSVDDVSAGFNGPLGRQTNYVTTFRYPSRGGFLAYAHGLARGARIEYGKRLRSVNFRGRILAFEDGTETAYEHLVSTIPLPVLIACAEDAPPAVRDAGARLRCTNFLMVNVATRHGARRPNQWIYVYDEDKLSTRISLVERFSPHNAPVGMGGISVEVYGSPYRPLPRDRQGVAQRVTAELMEMGLLDGARAVRSVHVRSVLWGNPIFDHDRQPALDVIEPYLDEMGVIRVGRFAQWDYLMTHDCVRVSKRVAASLGVPAATR